MSSTDERLLEIIKRLVAQTASGKVVWKVTDDENSFLYSGAKSAVLVSAWEDNDGDRNVRVRILNPRGSEVGSISSEWELGTESSDPWKQSSTKGASHNKLLEELHEGARRRALRIDEVLDSLFEELGE